MGGRIHLCLAPPLCEPCRHGVHDQCSWDGEQDCLCLACPADLKATNRALFDQATSPGSSPHTRTS